MLSDTFFCCDTDLPRKTSCSLASYAKKPSLSERPHSVTILLAVSVTILMSELAPVVTLSLPNIISSAIRPPHATLKSANSLSLAIDTLSPSGNLITIPRALPLGIIVAL